MEVDFDSQSERLTSARDAMKREAEAIRMASMRLDGSLLRTVDKIVGHRGKVVVTGIGKSGLIAQKIAATFCSTGTAAVYLHPADALHGDVGVYAPGDPTILISKSGTTSELIRLVPVLRQFESPLIGILGNLRSQLASLVDVVLDASVNCEADPCNLAPTSSAMVALALGDALSCALMTARGFTVTDFARFHPSGQLGRNVSLKVRDVFHEKQCVACVTPSSLVKEVAMAMTRFPIGAACVVSGDDILEGIITDGDLRRTLQVPGDIRMLKAAEIMTRHPVSIMPDASVNEALELMENRPSQITVLPVVGSGRQCLGLIRIHDIYSPAWQGNA